MQAWASFYSNLYGHSGEGCKHMCALIDFLCWNRWTYTKKL